METFENRHSARLISDRLSSDRGTSNSSPLPPTLPYQQAKKYGNCIFIGKAQIHSNVVLVQLQTDW